MAYKKHLKAVLLLGGETYFREKFLEYYSAEGFKVIGSDKSGFSLSELSQLAGLINSDTRIDILTHGIMTNGKHYSQIGANSNFMVETRELFSALRNSANIAVNIHYWGCNGDGAREGLSELLVGSALVTHTSEERVLLTDFALHAIEKSSRYILNKEFNIYEDFVANLALNAMSNHLSFYQKNSEDIIAFKMVPTFDDILKPLVYLEEISKVFQDKMKVKVENRINEEYLPHFQLAIMSYAIINENYQMRFFHAPGNAEILGDIFSQCIGISSPLHLLIEKKKTHLLRALIKSGIKFDLDLICGSNDNTPLIETVERNLPDIAQLFLENGADPDIQNKRSRTALLEAVIDKHVRVIDVLLKFNVDIDIQSMHGRTPLNEAVILKDSPTALKLIEAGADVNIMDYENFSPLYTAANNGMLEVVRKILPLSDNVDYAGCGLTAIQAAFSNGHINIARELIEYGADITNHKLIFKIIEKKDTEGLSLLLSKLKEQIDKGSQLVGDIISHSTDNMGDTLLVYAIKTKFWNGVKQLIEFGADANVRVNNWSPLMHLIDNINFAIDTEMEIADLLISNTANLNEINNGFTVLYNAISKNLFSVAEKLIAEGADVNIPSSDVEVSNLIRVVEHGHVEAIKMLLEAKADINYQTRDGHTALHYVLNLWNMQKNPKLTYLVMQILLQHEIDLTITPTNDLSVIEKAYDNYHVVYSIFQEDFFEQIRIGNINRIKNYIKGKLDPSITNEKGNNALHISANYCHLESIEFFEKIGVKYVANANGMFPFHTAVLGSCYAVAKHFLEHGKKDLPTHSGNLAVHLAAFKGDYDIVSLLLSYSDTGYMSANNKGYTPMDISLEQKHVQISYLFYSFGGKINKMDANELQAQIAQFAFRNELNENSVLGALGIYSYDDTIEMKEYGTYKGGDGDDTFIVYDDYEGKHSGYNLIILDFNNMEQNDKIDLSNFDYITSIEDLSFTPIRYLGEGAVKISFGFSEDDIVILRNQLPDNLHEEDFIFGTSRISDLADEL